MCLEETPNEETIAAMEEAEQLLHDPNAQTFSSVEELLAELKTVDTEEEATRFANDISIASLKDFEY